MKHNKLILVLFILMAVVFVASVYAQTDAPAMPIGLQRIIDFNRQSTADFAVKVSFFIAFLAGMLGILSPCILPFLPAYFAYTFKEKKNITRMTLFFFLGFSLVFVSMGVIAGFIGQQTLVVLQKAWLVVIAGIFLIGLGIMSLLGKGFSSYIKFDHKFRNDIPGVFLMGIFFAIGWTACLGPILAGILGIGAILNNMWYSGLLMLFYSFGNLVPLFILSILYDKYNLSKNKFIKGKMLKFSVAGKRYHVHSTGLISGILFLFLGTVMIIYKGTSVFNTWDFLGTKTYFYSLQNRLIAWEHANIFGLVIFLLFVIFVIRFLIKYKAKNNLKKRSK